MQKTILVKLGGSLITDKAKPYTARLGAIKRLAKEIKIALDIDPKLNLIVGNGGGSFPHTSAFQYDTVNGYNTEDQKYGFCKVQDDAITINRILVGEMLRAGVKAIGVSPNNIFLTRGKRLKKLYLANIERMLEEKIIPVVYGDPLFDSEIGCTIYSCDRVLLEIAKRLKKKKIKVSKFVSVGSYPGVYDESGKTIGEIDRKFYKKLKETKGVEKSKNTDVTGGMFAKLNDLMKVAKLGIEAYVIDGRIKGNLKNFLLGNKFRGTRVVG